MKHAILAACLLCASPAFAQQAATPSPFVVELSLDEANLIVNMLDAAVKQGGLATAQKLLPVSDKIIAAGRAAAAKDETAKVKAEMDKAKAETTKP